MNFWVGLIIGGAAMLLAAGAAAVALLRRTRVLERRTRHAERLAELGTLTGGLAHEIKNPLSTVQLNLQLLQEDLSDEDASPRVLNRLKTVQRETSRLRETLDDFLRYAGKMEIDRKEVDLRSLLDELADFYSPQAQMHRTQFRLKLPEQPVIARVDPKLIKQAVLNLLINALQAMTGGGELILSLRVDGPNVFIEVIDTGSGISPEVQARIFDAYYSTKRGGNGLGLAMTRRIIEDHGGKISVASEPGKGSRFEIRLPR